jgi:hypothetical protein
MNAIELTQLFVQYATLSEQLAVVKSKIEKEILILGESTKIAGVTATYYKPSNGLTWNPILFQKSIWTSSLRLKYIRVGKMFAKT